VKDPEIGAPAVALAGDLHESLIQFDSGVVNLEIPVQYLEKLCVGATDLHNAQSFLWTLLRETANNVADVPVSE
jgi:hypothetical protein